MLSDVQRSIITQALQIQKNQGKELADIPGGYKNLTDEEKTELLEALEEQEG